MRSSLLVALRVALRVGLVAVVGSPGCGVAPCEVLCAEQGACLEQEIARYESTWSVWTGFADRQAFEDACLAAFEGSVEAGGPAGEVRETCRQELRDGACPEPPES